MKRFLIYYIIGIGMLLTGCDNWEASDNGDLDGFWLLSEPYAGVTWSFQGTILELRDVQGHYPDVIMSFQYGNDELVLSDPYLVDREAGDVAVDDVQGCLMPYGVFAQRQRFKVILLTSDKMILEDGDRRLNLRKY